MKISLKPCVTISFLGLMLLAPTSVHAWTLAECSKVELKDYKTFAAVNYSEDQRKVEAFDDSGKSSRQKSDEIGTFLTKKATCMSRGERAISSDLLQDDQGTINVAYSSTRDFYLQKGFSKGDVAKIIALAWTDFRWTNPKKQMSGDLFIQLSTSYGQLTVNSDPAGASIDVDTRRWDDPTNRTDWTEAGERTVKLTKTGCKPEEGKVTVPAGGSATFGRKLTCS